MCAAGSDSDRETEEVTCVSVLGEGERKGKRLEEIVYVHAYVPLFAEYSNVRQAEAQK